MRLRHGFHWVATTLFFCHAAAASELVSRNPQDQLQIKTTHAVECNRKSHEGDTLAVHYSGKLKKNGLEFDSSYKRNEPISFQIGRGQVIAGWEKGLLDMCIGEERRLVIPPYLAYGNQEMGIIPAGSTLIFDTKLMAIDGMKEDTPPDHSGSPEASPQKEEPSKPHSGTKPSKQGATKAEEEEAVESQKPINPDPADPDPNPGSDPDEGECRLLGPFALVVQAGLGLLAILSLVWKRYRERPRRPVKIWFFDASKQVFGSVLLHILNLLMSMISSSDWELVHKAKTFNAAQMVDIDGRRINPCSFYLINIAIDTTIGIPILIVLLRLLHHGFRLTPLARPVESIKSGYYGQPPRATWWLKQALIYFIGLFLMKLCVFFIFQILPWIAWVGDWALRWTEGNEAIQITFVMFVFPLIMNALQYYIIDSFIKEPTGSEYQQAASGGDGHPGASYHSVSGNDSDRDSLDSADRNKAPDVDGNEVPERQALADDGERTRRRHEGPGKDD